ncbi:MAG: 3-methyl-2-oxobutanoate hydroxymethyltransferase [Gammaproteobacteria bacterium]|nr:3-methyl-2-oxobutanoate hydroxymethyltransferase [Gammaproteobacteria bacterium]MCH9763971.1 3-methyl-2-oxobutanoate hydroxymethyltransferase [Gammaproteobacteria bacterium]
MNIHDFKRKKAAKEKITFITCYDYPSARTISDSTIDAVLVGDTVAMTVHGHPSTVMATMDMMVLHTEAVARGLDQQFIVGDLPFLAYRISPEDTLRNVQRLMQAGAEAIKLEGADADICKLIQTITTAGIPVIGHIGLTPQSVHQLGGYKVQGRENEAAKQLLLDAKALEAAGCFALVIECVPATLARQITEALTIPTIGIGAGPDTDGQILVWHDLLGLQTECNPRFVKQFIEGKILLTQAINAYAAEVSNQTFPAPEHCYKDKV